MAEARAEDGVGEVCGGFCEGLDGVEAGSGAGAQAGDLGKMNQIQWVRLRPAVSSAVTWS